MSAKVEQQKVVSFTHQLVDEQGVVQELSDLPTSYVHGVDQRVFPEITEALEGKQVGDEVEVVLPPEKGFGVYNPDLTFSDDIANVPEEFQQVGAEATFVNDAGETTSMKVVKVENGKVFLDGNHMFAGKTMTFKIKVSSVRDATEQEIGSGQPQPGLDRAGMH
ncbi:MAG: peptidylprolyl isomerase [Thioalkalispiraceae bacterium]|jgi:FKBP-type peptidyl-prolyl cis-trans isomerase SlyD